MCPLRRHWSTPPTIKPSLPCGAPDNNMFLWRAIQPPQIWTVFLTVSNSLPIHTHEHISLFLAPSLPFVGLLFFFLIPQKKRWAVYHDSWITKADDNSGCRHHLKEAVFKCPHIIIILNCKYLLLSYLSMFLYSPVLLSQNCCNAVIKAVQAHLKPQYCRV